MKLLEQLRIRPRPEIYYFNTRREFYPQLLAAKLEELIGQELARGKEGVVFLCIGTDRSTGDSLGPLIGHKLKERGRRRRAAGSPYMETGAASFFGSAYGDSTNSTNSANSANSTNSVNSTSSTNNARTGALVYGTLERPVHAMNLEQYRAFVMKKFPRRVVVAVDASVGNLEHVGYVTLGKGSLKPGLGVSKDLCEVGDIFITGIVGGCTSFDPVMLQSVRLAMVMRMADCICDSICLVENFWDFPSVV